jgi:hypothetical protein
MTGKIPQNDGMRGKAFRFIRFGVSVPAGEAIPAARFQVGDR